MPFIIPGITDLKQYVDTLENKVAAKNRVPSSCVHCGRAGLWCHGSYTRKADRAGVANNNLNPVLIQRYFCAGCKATFSALPEGIPPRRWYLWEIQQTVFQLSLLGISMRAIAKKYLPSRNTISRWLARLDTQFRVHKDPLCGQLTLLGRTSGFLDFWNVSFEHCSLSRAMYLCHIRGVPIP